MNILIITHFFVPYGKVGAKRMTALAAFLIKKHENVYVLHANPEEYGNDTVPIPDCLVNSSIHNLNIEGFYQNPILKKMARPLQYWSRVKEILSKEHIRVVIISAGPFNYLSVVPKIKRAYPKIKCVIDFRDLLDGTQCHAGKPTILEKMGFILDKRVERKAVRMADKCLMVSHMACKTYTDCYAEDADKFLCIQNGYDDVTLGEDTIRKIEEIQDFSRGSVDNRITNIGVFGKYGFYDQRFYTVLVNAIKKMQEQGKTINLLQFGVHEKALEQEFINQGILTQYKFIESQGYERDLVELQKCDATIATSYLKEALGTKIFDYIWINRPIITINPFRDGEQLILTRSFERGFPCVNEQELEDALVKVVALHDFFLDKDESKRKKYGRNHQFEMLYEVIQKIDSI